ncbi:hypothetical protein BAUCODRAFT_67235, partial [Baudoinia panamericana UAMH 10762]
MFRRRDNNLPRDPKWPADFQALGFHVNEPCQIVKMSVTEGAAAEYFDFFHSDNERSNQTRKEAIHECARGAVVLKLAEVGVKPLHLAMETFEEQMPEMPHVTILATELDALKGRKDVIVVVNESTQDLGIWAYRLLMREGGIDEGSAVGLMKNLRGWDTSEVSGVSLSCLDAMNAGVQPMPLKRGEAVKVTSPGEVPGIIILNPGALIYSHELNKTFTLQSWLARPKPSAVHDHIRIDPVHNYVEGHKTPEAHVRTVFDTVIPYITRADVRLHIIGISDGAEAVLKFLDAKFATDGDGELSKQLEAVALIQPTHKPTDLKCEKLSSFLAAQGGRAKAWVLSGKPKGQLLAVPAFG